MRKVNAKAEKKFQEFGNKMKTKILISIFIAILLSAVILQIFVFSKKGEEKEREDRIS